MRDVNNGVYKAGFATTQGAYDEAVHPLFETLDWLDARLASRDRSSSASARPRPTGGCSPRWCGSIAVYHGHFKCNRRRLVDYENLWPYARRLYQWPGVRGTVAFDHFVRHYHYSHATINPHRIVPIGPEIDWEEPVPDAPRRAA